MNPKLQTANLIRQMLPPYKRQPVRLGFLRSLAEPLQILFAEFDTWRDDIRLRINVNSQVKVLEGYLRRKYCEPVAIKIVTYEDGLLPVGLETEGMMPEISDDQTRMAAVALSGEIREAFGNADFLVYVPEGLDTEQVRADIERYKQVLTRYKIIQN